MRWLVNLFVLVRASNLGQDAVIEIMIGLLGVMIAVLTLVAGLFAAAVAVASWFSFTAVRDEASKAASKTAVDVATVVASDRINQFWAKYEEASALTQTEREAREQMNIALSASASDTRRPVTSDEALRKGGL